MRMLSWSTSSMELSRSKALSRDETRPSIHSRDEEFKEEQAEVLGRRDTRCRRSSLARRLSEAVFMGFRSALDKCQV